MKIAVASSGLGHVARGIEAWARDVAGALRGRGEDVVLCKGGGDVGEAYEVVVPCWQRGAWGTRALVGVTGRGFFWRYGWGSVYDVEQSTFAKGLIRLLRERAIDVLHVQDPRLALLVQRARERGAIGTRTILGHGTEESFEFLQKIDYLQHLAPWHLEEAREAGFWKPTWTVIPNFIDCERFSPDGPNLREELEIPEEAVVVLTAAAIKRHHKRVDYLLDEFERLVADHPEVPAHLIVAGGYESDTDELVARGTERLGSRVRFLVRFPRERMADLYRTADAFALCSLKEMMPIALLEATSSGLPCLVNRHPVVEWMVGPGGAAIAMDRPGALAERLAEWLTTPETIATLGGRAREHCLANFSQDRVVDQMLEYYRFVMENDPVPTPGG